jgi:hypothetical protein
MEVRERSEPAAGAPSAECYADLHFGDDLRSFAGHRRLRPSRADASAGLARATVRAALIEDRFAGSLFA